ncbi:MAG TPA: ATP-binding protein [Terracidiphilus sp.]|nr:ATP-binding protein [Terracidiphilus sp.]
MQSAQIPAHNGLYKKTAVFSHSFDSYVASLDRRWPQVACVVGVLVVAISFTDWYVAPSIALGFLYIVPMLLAGTLPRRWPIPLLAMLCSFLREALAPFHWGPEYPTRMVFTAVSFMLAGLTVSLLVRSRREVALHVVRLEREIELRNAAQAESRAPVDTSPIAILTTDEAGRVTMANTSAQHLLRREGSVIGTGIGDYLAPVAAALERHPSLRTELECTGQRSDGESFLAHVWLSKYQTAVGTHAAIVVWDGSEELRSERHAGLDGTLVASRLVMAGMAHEVRSLASAAEAAYARLRAGIAEPSTDMGLLGSLLNALGKVGAVGYIEPSDESTCDIGSALQELRIIIEPMFADIDAQLIWPKPCPRPLVRFDHHALVQAMLNLARNSQRAIGNAERQQLKISVSTKQDHVVIEFEDTGGGVSDPDQLFQPFRSNSGSTGLGLYVSRESLRNAGGDLRYVRAPGTARFTIEVPSAVENANAVS